MAVLFSRLKWLSCCADGDQCLALTRQLVTGMCIPFMAQFQTGGAALAKLSERDFRQAIAIGPTPTDRCCRDAKDFTTAVRRVHLMLVMGNTSLRLKCHTARV